MFRLNTGDPAFEPERALTVNGYGFVPAPISAAQLSIIIRAWLEQDDATHWGDFEKGLAALVYPEEK
jgi:hypothetical protein